VSQGGEGSTARRASGECCHWLPLAVLTVQAVPTNIAVVRACVSVAATAAVPLAVCVCE
jgi:hypothetical protein